VRALLLAATALVAAASATAAGGGATRPLVSSVRVAGQGIDDPGRIAEILGLAAGEPIDRGALRDGVRTLYAGGEVEWLRIEGERTPGGLAVTVELSLRSRIAEVVVDAPDGGLRRRVRDWMELRPGEPVTQGLVLAAVRRARRELRERGFADARLDPSMDYDRTTNTVTVTVEVDPGAPLQLAAVELAGVDDPLLAAEVQPTIPAGERLTSRLEERLRRDVEAALRRSGHWEAQVVDLQRFGPNEATTLRLEVDPGYRYDLEVETLPEVEELVREAVPDPVEEDLHPAQTGVLAELVREQLQRRGYLLADVEAELQTDRPTRTLVVRADPGRVRRITTVRYPGAESIPAAALDEVVRVRPGRVRGLLSQRVDAEVLETDREAVAVLYRGRGFVDVAVGRPELAADGPEGVVVSFPVDEGRRWRVRDLTLTGLPADLVAALDDPEVIGLEGAPYDPRRVERVRRRLETALLDAGYPEASVAADVDVSTPGDAVVSYAAEPGRYVTIGEVVVAGLEGTRERVVRREVVAAGVVPGAPLSQRAILDAQRRVYELGLFRRVQIVTVPGHERRPERGLVVRLEEGRQRSYLFGIGWDNVDRLRVTLGWSHLNLLGGAHALSAEIRLSDREERGQLGLREHRVPGLGIPGYASVYRTSEEYDTWSQLRRGLILEVGDRRRLPRRTWLRYEYQIVDPDAPDDILSDLEREQQEIKVASVTPTLEWDTRDDPLVPTRGLLSSTSLEYAFPAFEAEAEFVKLQTFLSVYRPMLDGTGALGVRIGLIEPLGDAGDQPPNLQVPLATRFFGGGRVSHRAFATDRLGIVGETLEDDLDPIGGNALLLLNLEYVQPIRGILSAVAFADVGNVWASPDAIDLTEVRWGVGLGLRVATPAGPLRLEYGHKLDREEGESSGELFLSFGIPF